MGRDADDQVSRQETAGGPARPRSPVGVLLEPATVDGLELERRVLDVEVPREVTTELIEDGRRIGRFVEHDMRRHDVHARRDRPGVEVVDVVDALSVEDVRPDIGEVDAPGRGLQQNVDRLTQQAPGPRQDE